jgi:signal transduction histidine kinase
MDPDDFDEQRTQIAELMVKPMSSVTGLSRPRHKDGSWRRLHRHVIRTNLLAVTAVEALVSVPPPRQNTTERVEAEQTLRTACEELERQLKLRTAELAEARAALQCEIDRHARAVTALRRLNVDLENEAQRIAGALHDETGQLLTVAYIGLGELERDLPEASRHRVLVVRSSLDEVESQLRRLSHELRPRVLHDLGLIEGLKFLGDSVARRTGIRIGVRLSLEGRRYDPQTETVLYRVVREALTNVVRHAGAKCALVTFREEQQTITGSICDDGVGFDVLAARERPGASGLGLLRMQDRLEAVRGRLEIISKPGTGTEVRVTIPLLDNRTTLREGRVVGEAGHEPDLALSLRPDVVVLD